MTLQPRKLFPTLVATLMVVLLTPVRAEDTIKVGVLHSLSGTMAISETTLKDTMLMMVEEQNKKGGLLGKKTRGSSC
jgi:urea transport system substrate-binding protein